MHLPAPRSRYRQEDPSEIWTKSFLPSRAVGARWRWVFLTGTLSACAFLQLGNSSNADSQEPEVANATPVEVTKAAPNAEDATVSTTAPVADTTAEGTPANLVPSDTPIAVPIAATVKLNLIVDDRARVLEARSGQTVKEALASGGVVVEKLDRVWPSPGATKVSDGLKVRVQTVREKLETRTEKIAPGFSIRLTSKLSPGREQFISGNAGTATITEKVVYVGGKRAHKYFVSRTVTTPPQDKTIALGTDSRFMPHRIPYHKRYARAYQAERQLSARGGSPRQRLAGASSGNGETVTLRPIKCVTMEATGYAANEGFRGGGSRTATGMMAVRGAIAVDPRVIPLGTKLYVEGYGYGFACDTGGAIKGNRIDLAFNSVGECYRHGRRKMKVWILADVD